ncbi:MAG: flagellar basal body L-ring protein FlgH [Pseudomonadota bacterium]
MKRASFKVVVLLAVLVSLSGCVVQLGGSDYAPPPPVMPVAVPASDGSIFQTNLDVRWFEDLRAARVGDILTVRLQENTQAQKSSSTSATKNSTADIASPSILGQQVTRQDNPILAATVDSDSEFSGEGTSAQSNSLAGDITVTVVERLANGNLVIRGEKWVTLNQGDEFIRLSGIIRPFDIAPDNSVSSSRVANARITYSSKGVLAEANKMGLLQRLVQWRWFPN